MWTELARSVRKDRGFNILLYEKQTRLINSLLHDQRMREGQPTLKTFCNLEFKLVNCRGGGGYFHSKVIGMLVVFFRV